MAQADNPLVSVIVLCYNQARFVLETLESVKAQTYEHRQLIIVDDCSSDDSVAVIENWLRKKQIDCTFIRHSKNQGICRSLNDAVSAAAGKYISIVASDDIWLPDKIARQVEIMGSQPDDAGVLYSDAFQIDELGQLVPGMYIPFNNPNLSQIPPARVLDALLERNFIPSMTTLIRRSCYDVVGLYDENMPTEDWDMWLRIARRYSFIYSPTPNAKYRIHPSSFSRSDPVSMVTGTIMILTKQLDLGHLDEGQRAIVARNLASHSSALPRLYFDLANKARRNGNRAETMQHLGACIRSGKVRPPGKFVAWISLLGYALFGLRRLRWWRGFSPESSER